MWSLRKWIWYGEKVTHSLVMMRCCEQYTILAVVQKKMIMFTVPRCSAMKSPFAASMRPDGANSLQNCPAAW